MNGHIAWQVSLVLFVLGLMCAPGFVIARDVGAGLATAITAGVVATTATLVLLLLVLVHLATGTPFWFGG